MSTASRNADRESSQPHLTGIWLDGRAEQYPQLVPFSAGPVVCPGQNLVLFTTSTLLANLLSTTSLRLRSTHVLDPERPLPVTLDQYGLEFAATPLAESHHTKREVRHGN